MNIECFSYNTYICIVVSQMHPNLKIWSMAKSVRVNQATVGLILVVTALLDEFSFLLKQEGSPKPRTGWRE